ncbi:hypothetical protein DF049_20480 [Burkholderia cenocepacia]|nr:hypothetical protein DF049_20480 [Burkholderia cenocepacia]
MDSGVSRRFYNLDMNMFRNVNSEGWLVEIKSGQDQQGDVGECAFLFPRMSAAAMCRMTRRRTR